MKHKPAKLDRPERVAELKPRETLRHIGVHEDSVVCDIGSGTGIFTIPAAAMTRNTVYALEIDPAMLEIIAEKARQHGLSNISLLWVPEDQVDIADSTVDVALMVTVLHEIERKNNLLAEYARIMKPGAKLAVIEFHKRATPMGPPPSMRLSPEDVEGLLRPLGLEAIDRFDLGENMYGLVLEKKWSPAEGPCGSA